MTRFALGWDSVAAARIRGSAVSLLLALGGCAMRSLHIQAPDIINPVSMSGAVSTDVRRGGPTIGSLVTTLLSVEEQTALPAPYATVTTTRQRTENPLQEVLMERVKGSQRRAVKDLEIEIESSSMNGLFVITREGLTAEIRGAVVELE